MNYKIKDSIKHLVLDEENVERRTKIVVGSDREKIILSKSANLFDVDKSHSKINLFICKDFPPAYLYRKICSELSNWTDCFDDLTADSVRFFFYFPEHSFSMAYQRELIPELEERCPNTQFFIITESPMIIGNVKKESIFIMYKYKDDIIFERPDASYGMSVDYICNIILGLSERPCKEVEILLETAADQEARHEYVALYATLEKLRPYIRWDSDFMILDRFREKKKEIEKENTESNN